MIIKDGQITFSSGRTESARGGFISINDSLETATGFEDALPLLGENPLTFDERKEMAEYMINLWERYKTLVLKPSGFYVNGN